MKKIKLLLSAGILFLFTPVFSQTEILVWSDEFNGTGAPNPANWGYDLGNNGWGNNEVQNYTSLSQNSRQENGNLVIQAIKSNGNWTSARLLSRNKAEFKYGRLVFRAKLPTGSGTWPALWMLGSNLSTAGWPACGEIDVMEHVGKNPGIVQCALHTPSSYGNTFNKKEKAVPTFATEFHEYQFTWTAQKLDFYIDGIWYYTYNPAFKNASTWPFNQPFFFIMNIAMGGNWGSDPQYETNGLKNGIDPSLTSATMLVDWVRVYQTVSPVEEISGADEWPEGLKLQPNPSSGQFSVLIPEADSAARIQLIDMKGAVVFENKLAHLENRFDVASLAKGTYVARIFLNDRTYSGKVILQ